MAKYEDLTGRVFGRATVLRREVRDRGSRRWLCRCACGKEFLTPAGELRRGRTVSCGCYRRELSAIVNKRCFTIHGMCGTSEYTTWRTMRRRCESEADRDYGNYGGKGIRVCERWMSFPNFIADMGRKPSPQHTIERNDSNGNYEPSNCRWATTTEQARNRSTNLKIEYRGRVQCLTDWCKELSLRYTSVQSRLKAGWSPDRAFTTPIRRRHSAA